MQVSQYTKNWPIITGLLFASIPIIIMYLYLIIDTFTDAAPGEIFPNRFTLEHWRFLWEDIEGKVNIWVAMFNTFIFALSVTLIVISVSLTSAYSLSRLNIPFRKHFLAGVLMLHAFPSITLIIAIFLILQMIGLYNTLIGVILVKSALQLPLGIWIMKGFYDSVPWEIEMAGIQDGASRFTVWYRLVLPQVRPGLLALGLFSFLDGWSEYILPTVLAPANDVQVLSVYLASLIADDQHFDFNLFKSVGLFYAIPVILFYLFFQDKLMNIYGGGTKG
jgi:inositol-phosphate transport system permease protein